MSFGGKLPKRSGLQHLAGICISAYRYLYISTYMYYAYSPRGTPFLVGCSPMRVELEEEHPALGAS